MSLVYESTVTGRNYSTHLFAGRPVSKPNSQCHALKSRTGGSGQEEDREETVDEPAVPTHHEEFASFSTCNSG